MASSVIVNNSNIDSLEQLGFRLKPINDVSVEITPPRGWVIRFETFLTVYDNKDIARFQIVNFTVREIK